jgi:ribonuclease III
VSAASEKLDAFEKTLGYRFADRTLLVTALTHASLPKHETNYERLEFLGDRVLGLVVAEMLYRLYPQENEGHLAKRLTVLVQQKALVEVGNDLGIASYVRLSAGEKRGGGAVKDTILSDCLEAVIGAVYLDGGLEPARELVESRWGKLICTQSPPPDDPKTRLQEVAQAKGLKLPEYRLVGKSGTDHQPVFDVEVFVSGMGAASATASSKRAAEKIAAQKLLDAVERERA